MSARLTVLSGPSGVGKGSLVSVVRRRHPQVWLSVSATTRSPRPGEQDGVHYLFVDDQHFGAMVAAGELLEHADYAGASYGTPRGPVARQLATGHPALLEIELQGARQVREAMPDAHLVFLAPPSWEELVRRLTGRGTEDEERVARRLLLARDEMAAGTEFDEIIVNDDLEEAADRLVASMGLTIET
ncbi:MAG: gmk [Frankiales bacterium]|nr:gmk [Frankiales bacterium]